MKKTIKTINFETAVKLFNENPMHYISSKKFNSFILSLQSPFLVEIRPTSATNSFDYLKGDDVLKFCTFINDMKPKYNSKKLTLHGVVYEYDDKYIWTPSIKETMEDDFNLLFPDHEKPIGYLNKGSRMLFQSWDEVRKTIKPTLIISKQTDDSNK